MNITNVLGLPDALVNAIKNDPYTGGGDISITKLIDAPQRRVLYKKYKDFVVEDASERIWSLLGQAVHTILERSESKALKEQRLYARIMDWNVSGQFDRLDLHDECLDDYKVTTVYKARGDKKWEEQLNCLAQLARENGMKVSKLRIVAILRDWKKAEASRKPDYPQSNVVIIDVPVWSETDCLAYLRNRIESHKMAEAGEPMPCSDEERWYSGTTYAMKKDGGKRATKIFESKEELPDEIPKGYVIEERPGGYRRCAEYCEVSEFCQQWKADRDRIESADADGDGGDSSGKD